MANATGNITGFTNVVRNSKKTGNPFKIYSMQLDDGESYELGFSIPEGLVVGDTVSFMWDMKYGKRKADEATIRKTASGGGAATNTSNASTTVASTPNSGYAKKSSYEPKVFPVPATHGDRSIIRQNMLSHATRIVCEGGLLVDGKDTLSDADIAKRVIAMAYRLEKYAPGDRDWETP